MGGRVWGKSPAAKGLVILGCLVSFVLQLTRKPVCWGPCITKVWVCFGLGLTDQDPVEEFRVRDSCIMLGLNNYSFSSRKV